MKIIHHKKALVTGAASGIGRALALALAKEGADLFLLDVEAAKLAEVADEARCHGTQVVTRPCDLARPEEITAACQALRDHWGRLDILINNAGISYRGKTEEMTPEHFSRLLAINLHAPIQLTMDLLPLLLKQEEAHILNMCSILGLVVVPKMAAYQTSKFGLVGFSESLRAEYQSQGLGVTALCPGFVQTNIYQAMLTGPGATELKGPPKLFYASPEKVAARALKAIYRNEGVVPVTFLARVMWFVKRLTPRFWGFVTKSRRKKKAA